MNSSKNIGRYIDIILLGWDEKSEMIRWARSNNPFLFLEGQGEYWRLKHGGVMFVDNDALSIKWIDQITSTCL